MQVLNLAEGNRLQANTGAGQGVKVAELGRVKRDHAKLVDAIVAGVPATQVKDRMIALDTRRQQLEAELLALRAPDSIRLHPNMAKVSRRKLRELVDGLEKPARTLEVTKALQTLVDRIVLTPSLQPSRKRATVTVDLEGALAAIVRLAADTKDKMTGVATGRTMRAVQNVKGATSGQQTAPSKSMSKLVAGAGFGHWLQLSRATNL